MVSYVSPQNIMNKENKNKLPLKLKDLENEILYKNFKYKKYFEHLCNLIPNTDKEKLEMEEIGNNNFEKKGLVYVFVIENKILKIGQTIRNIKERVQSYNSGKYRNSGITNSFILKSILKINKKVEVYALFPDAIKFEIFGEKYSHPPVREVENKILKDFKNSHEKLPIGCAQT